jgi:cytochrome P450
MGHAIASSLADDFAAIAAGDAAVDRHAVFARCRTESPIFFSELLDSWVVSRYDDVLRVLRDNDGYGPIVEGPGSAVYGRGFLHWRGREHNKKSGVVSRRIRSRRAFTEQLDAQVDRVTRELADALPLGEPVDLREAYAVAVPVVIIAELTGLPEATKVRRWYDEMMAGGTASIGDLVPGAREKAFQALRELREVLEPALQERQADPGEDLLSDLLAARYEGRALDHEEIVAVVAQLLPAGAETSARALASAFARLAADPGEWDDLRAVRADTEALLAYAAELLRCHPPLQSMTRVTREDRELAGTEIAAGDTLVLLVASANRDETHFAAAETFDRTRFAANPDKQFTSLADILPFGGGEHHCPGSRLAAAEIVESLRKLMERVERLELVEPAPPVGGLFMSSPAAVRVILHAAA